MKTGAIVAGIVLVLVAFGAFIHSVNLSEQEEQNERQAWLEFTMQHHCHIVRNPTFGNPTTTWQCDGNFEVVR